MTQDPSTSATLTVVRNSPKDIKMRGLEVFLDDQFLIDLPFEGSVKRSIPSGDHILKVTNRLFSAKASFTAKPGESIRFEASNVADGVFSAMMIVVGMGPYKAKLRRV